MKPPLITQVAPPPVYGFIVGPSGIGKGYGVGQPLTEYFGVNVFVTGDHCRLYMEEHAGNGHLVDDGLIFDWVRHDFALHHTKSYLIDAPRSIPQVQSFIKLFGSMNPLAQIVTIHITGNREHCEALIRDRAIRQNRPDDACPKAIKRRLDTYFGDPETEKPGLSTTMVPYLRMNTDYHPIDGNQDLETHVRKHVRQKLGPSIYSIGTESEPAPGKEVFRTAYPKG